MPTDEELEKNHPYFPNAFRASHPYVWRAAYWAQHHFDCDVAIPAQILREHISQRHDFKDRGDFFISLKNTSFRDLQRIEVKHRNVPFTSAGAFPFKTVFVGAYHAMENPDPMPLWHIVLNEFATGLFLINDPSTRDSWILHKNVWVPNIKQHCDIYGCPKELCEFYTMGKQPNEH